MKVHDIESFLFEKFPAENAMSYDNVGLIAGDRNKDVSAIVISLDLTQKAIEAAKANGANLIITHHPIIFGGIKRLTMDDFVGRTLVSIVKPGISVIACHTNLDCTENFGNLAIADVLGAQEPEQLPNVSCGIVYELEESIALGEYCHEVVEKLNTSGVITLNNPSNRVSKVFIQGGAFDEDSIDSLIENGVDTVVSGEIKHHICVGLEQMGINSIIAGHSATEQAYLPKLEKMLTEQYPGISITVNYNNEVASIL